MEIITTKAFLSKAFYWKQKDAKITVYLNGLFWLNPAAAELLKCDMGDTIVVLKDGNEVFLAVSKGGKLSGLPVRRSYQKGSRDKWQITFNSKRVIHEVLIPVLDLPLAENRLKKVVLDISPNGQYADLPIFKIH